MTRQLLASTVSAGCVIWLGCTARSPTPVHGIEPEAPLAPPDGASSAASGASGADHGAASSPAPDDFVYSREPRALQAQESAQLPIHINAGWWPFRAQHLGIGEEQAQKRDARLSRSRAPAGFWDAQTSVEAVSVWSVLCNECHGGRRSLQDALEMPEPAPGWGEGEGLFFGNRRAYSQMFNVVQEGGPARVGGRAQMPAWRNILSTEMIWALLYFLEYQSGGIESRFPPSLYPRGPKMLSSP